MASNEDTEITLGTGKMLALFFGLVALCAVFFGIGFSLGKNSAKPGDALTSAAPSAIRPTAVKANNPRPPSDLTFYKAVGQKDADAKLSPTTDAPTTASADSKAAADDGNAPPALNTVSSQSASAYYVQVAAVSKEEDAGALVDALKKKQYAAFAANTAGDKLFHVQVGPFSDIKDAEVTRGKLVSDGYNPILKK
jgi:cell division septation protein DedD